MGDLIPRRHRTGYVHLKPPAAPVLSIASLGNGVVNLTWTIDSDASGYGIWMGTSAGGEGLVPLATVSGTTTNTYSATGLTNGVTYYFFVKGTAPTTGYGPASNEVSGVPFVAPPLAPTNLTSLNCDARGSLSWTGSAGATSYNVYQSATPTGTYTEILTGIPGTTTPVGSLTDGVAAYFKVTAVGPGGESPLSNYVEILPFQLLAPAVTATAGDAQVQLSFATQNGILYQAFMGTTSGGETTQPVMAGTGTGGTLNWTITGLTDGQTYYFKVTATNVCGQNQTSTEVSATPVPLAQLSGLLWTMMCLLPPGQGGASANNCVCPASNSSSTTLVAKPGTSFMVTIRLRGVMEAKDYTGGTNDGEYWQIGGAPVTNADNWYELSISSPAQTYYINRGWGTFIPGADGGVHPQAVDFNKTIQIDAGATVTFTANAGYEPTLNEEQANAGIVNISVSDNDPTHPIQVTQPYNGQFAQFDATSITYIP